MPRIARVVVPNVPHHVTQRGNRGETVFREEGDAARYLELVKAGLDRSGTRCLAWCLMPNHVHFILLPADADGLRGALADAHRRYTQALNRREDARGYLWQGRFASFPMDDSWLQNAALYIERNPVAAKLAMRAEDWRWSSAKAHVTGRDDGITDLSALDVSGLDWGQELAGWDASVADAIEAHARTGRPLGTPAFTKHLETEMGRPLTPGRRGRKPKSGTVTELN